LEIDARERIKEEPVRGERDIAPVENTARDEHMGC
jgi:hypothetical protein